MRDPWIDLLNVVTPTDFILLIGGKVGKGHGIAIA